MNEVAPEGKRTGTTPTGCLIADGNLAGDNGTMEERDFFTETIEQRTHTVTCPKCGQAGEYKVTWIVRRKRQQLPRHADERDRARFAKAQSYMVRRDDKLGCQNIRCRKPFEITSLQSLAFLQE
jgi:adenine-specific DNA methylase